MRELADQAARRVDQQRQPLGQIGARGELGMGDQAGQHPVEQLDMIGTKMGGALQKQLADPACGVRAAFRVTTLDDIVKFREQRCRCCHKSIQTGRFGWFSGNLGGVSE